MCSGSASRERRSSSDRSTTTILHVARLAHHIANLVFHMHALRERAQVQADHGAGQPVPSRRDDFVAGAAFDHDASCLRCAGHAAATSSARDARRREHRAASRGHKSGWSRRCRRPATRANRRVQRDSPRRQPSQSRRAASSDTSCCARPTAAPDAPDRRTRTRRSRTDSRDNPAPTRASTRSSMRLHELLCRFVRDVSRRSPRSAAESPRPCGPDTRRRVRPSTRNCRYRLILLTPARSTTASTPIARMPSR